MVCKYCFKRLRIAKISVNKFLIFLFKVYPFNFNPMGCFQYNRTNCPGFLVILGQGMRC